ncbi:hypothetical protein V1264_008140 [Littorina saxatilis]|uniref:Reverse transcriptase n=2 Tax=Littorina saxatilis TaxID=31220 RepID=A0AAN9AT06_9CAEN
MSSLFDQIRSEGQALGLTGTDLVSFVVERERLAVERERLDRDDRAIARRENAEIELERERSKQKEFELERARLDTRGTASSQPQLAFSFKPKLPAFNEDVDDIDAYLFRYEVHAKSCNWPADIWVIHLSSLLTGKALIVYHSLAIEQELSYPDLKEALLKRFQCSEEGFREKFRSCKPEMDETFPAFLARMQHYLLRWVELKGTDKSYSGLTDLLLQEQLLQSCNKDVATFLRERHLSSVKEMIEVAEFFREAHPGKVMAKKSSPDLWVSCFAMKEQHQVQTETPQQRGIGRRGGRARRWNQVERHYPDKQHSDEVDFVGPDFCKLCLGKGHWKADCPNKKIAGCALAPSLQCSDCSMIREGKEATLKCGHIIPVLVAGGKGSCHNLPISDGKIGGQHVRVLRDTGCTTVGVRKSLVLPDQYTGDIACCISFGGRVERFPVALIDIDTPFFAGRVKACVVDEPVCDLILGNIEGVIDVQSPSSAPALAPKSECHSHSLLGVGGEVANVAKTRSMAAKSGIPKPLLTPEAPKMDIEQQDMARLQVEDETLKLLFLKAKNGDVQQMSNGTIRFEIRSDLLYRVSLNTKTQVENTQLLLPKTLRKTALVAAHDSILSAHSGVSRTTKRVLSNFFWPGVRKEIRVYCQTCDICQRTTPKGRVPCAPLEKMPLIDEAFRRVAVDLVGPIQPPTARGHRYILTIVDVATRFPEAVPMTDIDTPAVAEALLGVFSRVGFPVEVLSDRGSQFTSDMMREVMRLMSIHQLHTSPYHAQTNGMVERFNGTLRMMLRRVVDENCRDWDRYIPALLFAYRELPNESLGFSPFELLYGRTPRGPMKILEDLWTGEVKDPEVQTTYQYVFELRNKLSDTCRVAQEAAEAACTRYKSYHDKKAVKRSFHVGDEVLVLLPTTSNKLLLKWKGPFPVRSVSGPVDYAIEMNGKRKLFHVNMLKRYLRRDETIANISVSGPTFHCFSAATSVVSLEDETTTPTVDLKTLPSIRESYLDVKYNPERAEECKRDLEPIFACRAHMMTTDPGTTGLEEHSVKVTTDKPIHLKPYPMPFTTREVIEKEVRSMLELGVIEPSTSAFSSPIVLVKKKDGTNRFCIDFRALNRITVFDAEPIPDIEELFARLSQSRFFTKIDLAKGYWQIPMATQDKHKTAFQTPLGLFQCTKMAFGLVTAPATFARMMRKLHLEENMAVSFFDDILIATEDWQSHLISTEQVLDKLDRNGLTVRPSKVEAGFEQIEFLGHIIGHGTMRPVQSQVDKMLKLGRPETKKQVRAIIGLISYYRRYVPKFSDLVSPLTNLTKGKLPNKVKWDEKCQVALEKIQEILSEHPVIVLPDFQKPFTVRTDASNIGIGAVLLQERDGRFHPVTYASRKLLDREQRYSTVERECLAIVWAVDKFSRYLYGQEFMLETDHRPLTYLKQSKLKNGRLTRWALALQEHKFQIVPIAGQSNIEADVLSRCPVGQ